VSLARIHHLIPHNVLDAMMDLLSQAMYVLNAHMDALYVHLTQIAPNAQKDLKSQSLTQILLYAQSKAAPTVTTGDTQHKNVLAAVMVSKSVLILSKTSQ